MSCEFGTFDNRYFNPIMQKKAFCLFILNLMFVLVVFGQEQNEETPIKKERKETRFKDKLVLGGNVGANFGTRTFVQFSPVIGYRIKPKLISGIGLNYNYFSDPFQKGSIYGPSVFTRYQVMQGLFLHTEFQQSFAKFELKGSEQSRQVDFPMFLLGGGYYTTLGGSSRIGITVLFDVIEDRNSFYQNPIIRGGVLFGL